MALDKKQYDHGTIDSAEELDAYGVWVKSEPQDFTAGLAETDNFDAEAMPYEANFDQNFDSLSDSDFTFGDEDTDTGFPAASLDDSDTGVFGEETTAYSEQGGEEASNRLLMKIAGELSSIKSELNLLKREFAEIRAESGSVAKDGEQRGGFFAEDDDEKIALTGDEMDHFLSSTDFSEEDGLGYDTLREKDEAALKELSEQNEISSSEETSASSEADLSTEEDLSSEEELSSGEELSSDEELTEELPDEEIQIDFDNLGIDLSEEAETQDEFPPLEDEALEEPSLGAIDDLDTSSIDSFSFDEVTEESDAGGDLVEELAPLDESEELRDLRLEGATPLTPAPDNSNYLETDPFALDTSDFGGDENAVKEDPILGAAVTEETAEDTLSDDLSFSEDLPIAESSDTEDLSLAETSDIEDLSFDDSASLGDSATLGGSDDISFDDSSFDLGFGDDNFTIDTSSPTEEEASSDLTLETSAEEELAEPVLAESAPIEPAIGEPVLDDSDLTLPAIDDSELSFDAGSTESSETLDDSDLSFDTGSLELSATGLDDTDFSFDDDDSLEVSMESPADESLDASTEESAAPSTDTSMDLSTDESTMTLDDADLSAESPAPLDEEISEEPEFDADSIDLSEAVIDEPDLSAGIVEAPLEEPVLDEISFDDDISLDMDDFGSSIVAAGDSEDHDIVQADSGRVRAIDDGGDDSLAQIIPEGFEVNAEEAAVSMDDDLEAFSDDELALAAGTSLAIASTGAIDSDEADIGINPNLKGELKSVLAYMDHLLESLPEDKIEEFAKSEYFDTYKKIFKELGLV